MSEETSEFHGLGTTFYPEHQAPETWERHIKLMVEAGISFVRLGEFNWNLFEPEEGEYNLEWMDDILDMLEKAKIKVFFSTQTATPPLWACEKYPDILPILRDGATYGFGERRYTCPSSSNYRRLSRNLVGRLGRKFADDKRFFAWQLDNEPGSPFCFCGNCLKKFQKWCKIRFETISAFNEALLTQFWGQTFKSFSEIPFPNTYNGNSLWLLYHQFHSDNIISTLKEQVEELKKSGVSVPITTNMMLAWYGYDHEKMGTDLDVAGGDLYNSESFFGEDWASDAFFSAYLRATKHGENFWFEEVQVGLHRNIRLPPGFLRFQTLSRIGMGANMINFFRWDMARAGAERDECALLNNHEPGRVYYEIKGMGSEVAALAPYLNSTTVKPAEIAILHTWENHYEFAEDPKLADFEAPFGNGYPLHLLHHYRAICQNGHTADLVYPGGEFDGYKCLVIPALYVLTKELAEKIKRFVDQGGICLMTSLSCVVDENGLMWNEPRPALLRDVFGVKIIDYSRIYEKHGPCEIILDEETRVPSKWIDEITTENGCDVKMKFVNKFFNDFPALTQKEFGDGEAWYFGSILDSEDYSHFYRSFLGEAGISPRLSLPDGVSLSIRHNDSVELYFLANENEDDAIVNLPTPGVDISTGCEIDSKLIVKGRDVKIVKLEN